MGRKSTIKKLDPRIREAVDAAIRDGRATIDELVELIERHGGEASRSAVGRYVKNTKAQMEKFRQAKEIAKVWVGKIDEDPDGDVGRLISEMLRTVAFQTISNFDDSEEGASAGELMFIAKAIKELAQADKLSADREINIRREFAKKAAEAIENSEAVSGMTRKTVDAIKREILGLA
jgi:hypothetical protein